jgi:hypothetical protein
LRHIASIRSALRRTAGLAIAAVALASASQANAAQILDGTVIWQVGGNGADKALNEQTGPVSPDNAAYSSSSGWFILDLGAAYDLSSVELFSLLGANFVSVQASNQLSWDGFNDYLSGGETLFSGALLADSGETPGQLTAQAFASTSGVAYRYLQVTFGNGSQPGALNEIRLFDTTPTGVPEPASWALMLCGFGLAGVVLRRQRRQVARLA